jgi:hypothetical protein
MGRFDGGGVSDHGDLDGLADDDHTQYTKGTEIATIKQTQAEMLVRQIYYDAQHAVTPRSYTYAVPDKMTQAGGENSTINDANSTAVYGSAAYNQPSSAVAESDATNATEVVTTFNGIKINTNTANIVNIKCVLHSLITATKMRLCTSPDGTGQVAEVAISANSAIFEGLTLANATDYYLLYHNDGASYDRRRIGAATYPQNSTYADMTGGVRDGAAQTTSCMGVILTTFYVVGVVETNSLATAGTTFIYYAEGANITDITGTYAVDGGADTSFSINSEVIVTWTTSLIFKMTLEGTKIITFTGGCLLYE